jgi:hypothetical protein
VAPSIDPPTTLIVTLPPIKFSTLVAEISPVGVTTLGGAGSVDVSSSNNMTITPRCSTR